MYKINLKVNIFLVIAFCSNFSFSQNSTKQKTRFTQPKPDGVCFEGSTDRYRIKKKHTVSALMNYFELRPLYCKDCSVETAENVNKLEDVDYILPGQILVIPKKCDDFSWVDTYDYSQIQARRSKDAAATEIMNNRNRNRPQRDMASVETPTVIESEVKEEVSFNNKNNLFISPFVVINNLNTSSANIKAKLKSDLGQGIIISYKKEINTDSMLNFSGFIYQNTLKNDSSTSVVLENQNILPYGLSVAYGYQIHEKMKVGGQLSALENYFVNRAGESSVAVEHHFGYQGGVFTKYSFLKNNNSEFSGLVKWEAIGPQSTSVGTTSMGSFFSGSLQYDLQTSVGQFLAGLEVYQREQRTDEVIFSEQSYMISVGYGFGI